MARSFFLYFFLIILVPRDPGSIWFRGLSEVTCTHFCALFSFVFGSESSRWSAGLRSAAGDAAGLVGAAGDAAGLAQAAGDAGGLVGARETRRDSRKPRETRRDSRN